MHPGKTIKGESHFVMALFWCCLAFVRIHSRYWLASVWCQRFPCYTSISGYEDTNVFHFPRLWFVLVYNQRVATISFDQKRERGFDEQLAHILKFKQTNWAPLVWEMWAITAMYSHHRWIGCNWMCTMELGKRKGKTQTKTKTPFTPCFPLYVVQEKSLNYYCIVANKQELNTLVSQSCLCFSLPLFSGEPNVQRIVWTRLYLM